MNDEEKRQLAEMLAPHLAWDLSRSEVLNFNASPDTSGAAAEMFIAQIVNMLRAKMHRGESFAVAIIPKGHRPPNDTRA